MASRPIEDLQRRLASLGFSPGPIDNEWGPKTRRAVMDFQASAGLRVDGIVGPKTRAALFGDAARAPRPASEIPTDMPWLHEAARLRGTQEVVGKGSNPVIIDWAEDLEVSYKDDDIPWCGLFTAHCVRTGLPEAALPSNILGARQWLSFGETAKPQLGSILVFWRGSREGWQGHVGFYWAEDEKAFHVLGGNQNNSVNITRIERRRLLGARWPSGVRSPGIIRQASSGGQLLSTNEA